LLPHDFTTPTWRRLTQLLEARLQELREANDRPIAIEKTALIRGQISAIKDLLDLQRSTSHETVPVPGDGELLGYPASNDLPE
jgi:hypothetical protein